MKTVRDLLADYAALLNRHGPDSVEALDFALAHKDRADFWQLAALARGLKRMLTAKATERREGRCDAQD